MKIVKGVVVIALIVVGVKVLNAVFSAVMPVVVYAVYIGGAIYLIALFFSSKKDDNDH